MRTRKKTAIDHPSQDRTWRFPLDALLRQHGFRIAERREGLQPIWEKGGRLFSEFQALRLLDPSAVADAHYLTTLRPEESP